MAEAEEEAEEKEAAPVFDENRQWKQRGDTFWPDSKTLQTDKLPPGVYRWHNSLGGWYLERTNVKYEFPYKIYGKDDHITSRIQTAWDKLESNFGVMFTGMKGTGKTVTAQRLANWAIERGMPVLVVNEPVPLDTILAAVEQDLMVLFDEFEKTHPDHARHQQPLLSTIDGLSRSQYRRLFLFTTNAVKLEENFLDRPSRIRYTYEFKRLSDDVIQELIADLLDPELEHLKSSVLIYLAGRKVLSIDVAKSVIKEVNIFRQDPQEFAEIMNLTEREAGGYIIDLLGKDREVIANLTNYFSPGSISDKRTMREMVTKFGRQSIIERLDVGHTFNLFDNIAKIRIMLIGPGERENEWLANIAVQTYKTWIKSFRKLEDMSNDMVWMNDRPEGWTIPDWAIKAEKLLERGEEVPEAENSELWTWINSRTVFGGEKGVYLIRVEPNLEIQRSPAYNYGGAF